MNRKEINQHNQNVIALVAAIINKRQACQLQFVLFRTKPPKLGYKELAQYLNAGDVKTSRGRYWTMRGLYRMMQRNGLKLINLQSK